MTTPDEVREQAPGDHDFQGIVTKLRTTRGSLFALDVMSDAADRIESDAIEIAALKAVIEKVAKLHHSKAGWDERGEYVICDYDKTKWPCKHQQILASVPSSVPVGYQRGDMSICVECGDNIECTSPQHQGWRHTRVAFAGTHRPRPNGEHFDAPSSVPREQDTETLPLDPLPFMCMQDHDHKGLHTLIEAYCMVLRPRPGFEQDEARYRTEGGE